jgi:hypothetical protein
MKTVKVSPLAFVPLEVATETVYLEVRVARTQVAIGNIGWEPPWRKFAFTPLPGRAYTREVLMAINRKLYRLMHDWQKDHPNARRGLPPLPKPTRYDSRGRPPKHPPENPADIVSSE